MSSRLGDNGLGLIAARLELSSARNHPVPALQLGVCAGEVTVDLAGNVAKVAADGTARAVLRDGNDSAILRIHGLRISRVEVRALQTLQAVARSGSHRRRHGNRARAHRRAYRTSRRPASGSGTSRSRTWPDMAQDKAQDTAPEQDMALGKAGSRSRKYNPPMQPTPQESKQPLLASISRISSFNLPLSMNAFSRILYRPLSENEPYYYLTTEILYKLYRISKAAPDFSCKILHFSPDFAGEKWPPYGGS